MDNDTKVTLNIGLSSERELVLSDRLKSDNKAKEPHIPFVMLGKSGYTNIKGVTTMSADILLTEFNKQEAWLYKLIRRRIDYTTLIVTIRGADLDQSEKRKLLAAYKTLREKDIIRRVKREYYMVNPMFLVPSVNRDALVRQYLELG